MLDAGADIHAQNAEGDTVLHIVARNLANNIAGVLIERGADMDARNKMNRTPVIMMGGSAKRSNSFYKMNSLGQPN
jgi:ankyrin repeat protein